MDFILPLVLHYKLIKSNSKINLNFYKKFTTNILKKTNIYFLFSLANVVFWNLVFPIIIHGTDKFKDFIETLKENWDNNFEKYFKDEKIVKFLIISFGFLWSISYFDINKKTILYGFSFICCFFHFVFELYAAFNEHYQQYDYQVILFDDIDREFEIAPQNNPDNPRIIENDAQNVHDSQVNKSLRKTYKDISQVTQNNIDKIDTFKQIRDLINKQKDNVKKQQLNFIIDYIEKNKTKISGLNACLSDVLHLIWNRIHSDDCIKHKETLYENLLFELRDSTNVNVTNKCLTGIWARLMDTANKIDPLVNIKPKWALRRELLNKANKIYEKMEHHLSKEKYKILTKTQLNQEESTWFNKFKKKYQKTVKRQCYREYVDTNIIEKQDLDNELSEWLDTIL